MEVSRLEIERLRADLALAHLRRKVLEEMAAHAKMIAELSEGICKLAIPLKSLKEG